MRTISEQTADALRQAKGMTEQSDFQGWAWENFAEVMDVAKAADERLREAEGYLRKEWWKNHGHDIAALYGDDGEMQCHACPADFKRQPIDKLAILVSDARIERFVRDTGGSA